ncbi:DUF2071 domain-containing protein [Dokdonia sp. PRO95]|uniref:YqjF family protein n=1 Tax=Dokdonia sp. PRO95 TaxID=1239415 RepID=UPI0005547E3E|nr:DUF2071 domain-containing protein [Dokdonia sp. PRO95]
MSFLTAAWRQLAFINYEVDPALLEPYVPHGTELDFYEGKCYVSVIAFMFMDTRIKGVKIPFHVNFEEVNLRFYVRRKDGGVWKRGAVFIKEVVPKPAISIVANALYNESYETLPMRHKWDITSEDRKISYGWKKDNKWQSIDIEAAVASQPIDQHSEMEFIAEHYWGYASPSKVKTNEYEVTHPRWNHYPIKKATFDIKFETMYGAKFSFLQAQEPASIYLIEGSAITIEGKTVIKK